MLTHHRAHIWRSTYSYNRRLRFRRDVLTFREYLLSLVNYLRYRDID